MKNLRLLLLALPLLLLGVPKSHAVWTVSDATVSASQVPDMVGQYFVFEQASKAGLLGYYVTASSTERTSLVDSACVWTLVPTGTNEFCGKPQYVLKNLKTGLYWDFPDGYSHANATFEQALNVVISSATCEDFDYNGNSFSFATRAQSEGTQSWDGNSVSFAYVFENEGTVDYYMPGQYSGNTSALWGKSSGDAYFYGTNAWNIHPVEWEEDAQADLQAAIDEYDTQGYATTYKGGNDPFQTTLAAYEAMIKAYDDAITGVGEELSDEEYRTLEKNLRAAVAAAAGSQNPFTDGYYYVKTANKDFTDNASKPENANMAWYAYGDYLAWSMVGLTDTAMYVWKITQQDDGSYVMQNMSNGRFIKGPNTVNYSQYVRLSDDFVAAQEIKHLGGGHLRICQQGNTYSYGYYHQSGHGGGSGTNSYVVTWSEGQSNGSAWRLEAVNDAELIARLEKEVVQNILDNKMSKTMTTALNDSASAMVTTVIGEKLITDASQLYSNNKETTEGTYEALIDGNTTTFFHSAWSASSDVDDAYHYLQFNSPTELPTSIKIGWTKRSQNNANRPSLAVLSASADGNTWTMLGDTLRAIHTDSAGVTTGELPILNTVASYFSEAFTVPAGMTKLRLTVYETRTAANATTPDGSLGNTSPTYHHPFFTFSEFQVYTGSTYYGCEPGSSQALRADMAPAYEALVAAIAKARAVQNDTAVQVTQADIDDLQAAIDAFEALWVDSAAMTSNMATAQKLIENAVIGTDYGQFDQTSVDKLQSILSHAQAKQPLYLLTKEQFDAADKEMEDGLQEFHASMVVPAEGWYYVVSNVSETNRPEDSQPTRGRLLYAAGYDANSNVLWGGTSAENETNARAGWRLINYGNGYFALQNIGSGWYLGAGSSAAGSSIQMSDTVHMYRFISLGKGEMALQPEDHPHLHAQWAGQKAVNWTGVAGSASSWTFEAVDDAAFTEVKSFASSGLSIITLPYSTTEAPYATSGGQVEFFDLSAVKKDGEGMVLALDFSTHDGHLVAGTPYLMRITVDGEDPVLVDMLIDHEAYITHHAGEANGLVGTLRSVVLNEGGRGYLKAGSDTIYATGAEAVTIAPQEGYIKPHNVNNLGTEVSLMLVVANGGDGFVNAIKPVLTLKGETVNVYTADGVLVRRHVKATEALNGLSKGLYIVGGQKVIVR